MRYEPEYINFKAMAWFVVGFVASLVLIFFLVRWVEGDLPGRELRTSVAAARDLAPEPRLQSGVGHSSSEQQDLRSMQAEQELQLHSYGTLKYEPGFVHIPINEAMKLYVEKQ